jgi:sugar phosphate isomerase/epimerase
MTQLVASPCSNPGFSLNRALSTYGQIGYEKFEAFTSWAQSALDMDGDAPGYRALASLYGISYASFHLPPITDDLDASLARALKAARFADRLGATVAIYKADSIANYVQGAPRLLDALDKLDIIPVLQNHAGSALSTPEDYRQVLAGIADERMRCLLEIGHFHLVGVSWQEGYDLLGERVALVHLKDHVGTHVVPLGQGESDIAGLVQMLQDRGYAGDYVIEMEVPDEEEALRGLAAALDFMHEQGVK